MPSKKILIRKKSNNRNSKKVLKRKYKKLNNKKFKKNNKKLNNKTKKKYHKRNYRKNSKNKSKKKNMYGGANRGAYSGGRGEYDNRDRYGGGGGGGYGDGYDRRRDGDGGGYDRRRGEGGYGDGSGYDRRRDGDGNRRDRDGNRRDRGGNRRDRGGNRRDRGGYDNRRDRGGYQGGYTHGGRALNDMRQLFPRCNRDCERTEPKIGPTDAENDIITTLIIDECLKYKDKFPVDFVDSFQYKSTDKKGANYYQNTINALSTETGNFGESLRSLVNVTPDNLKHWVLIDAANALSEKGCYISFDDVKDKLHIILKNISADTPDTPCEVFLFAPIHFNLHKSAPPSGAQGVPDYTRQIGIYVTQPIVGNPLKRETLEDRIHIYGTRRCTEEDDILLLLLAKRLEKYSQEQRRPRTICNSPFKELFVSGNRQGSGWPRTPVCTINNIYCITADNMGWYQTK